MEPAAMGQNDHQHQALFGFRIPSVDLFNRILRQQLLLLFYPFHNLIRETVRQLRGYRREVEHLEDKLRVINEFLIREAKGDQRGRGHEHDDGSTSTTRISDIRKVAFCVEDLLELYDLQKEYSKYLLSDPYQLVQFRTQVDSIKVRVRTITDYITSGKLSRAAANWSTACGNDDQMLLLPPPLRQCTPGGGRERPVVIGLESDTLKLVSQLTRRDSTDHTRLSSVSIVGMGGTGKTTLAGKVYAHPAVVQHFSCRFWIPATEQFDYKDLLIAILLRTKQLSGPFADVQDLEARVHQLLQGRTYLAVLDDLWTQEAWDRLNSAFPADTCTGSRLIVTTRNSELITGTPGGNICHPMKPLNLQESRQLFSQLASLGEEDPECEDIRERILNRCAGLPLAVVAIGGALKRERRREKWERVCHELTSLKGGSVQELLEVLALSYHDLSPDLKACFLRISFFPQDQEISARKLVYLWAANGLLDNHNDQGMENLGITHLGTLIKRNMIQAVSVSLDGAEVKRCKLHPLMHALSTSTAEEEILFQSQSPSEIRHKAIYPSSSSSSSSSSRFGKAPHLHSLLTFPPEGNISAKLMGSICSYSKLLKVLYLEGINFGKLPSAIDSLWNLRYLNLRNTGIRRLPESIKSLLRLLTLDVSKNPGLKRIGIVKRLKKLRNLHLDASLEPLRIGSLENLGTLGWVHAQQIERNDLAKLVKLEVLKVVLTNSRGSGEFLQALNRLVRLVCLKLYIKNTMSSLPLSAEMFSNMQNLRTLHLKLEGSIPNTAADNHGFFLVPAVEELAKLPNLSTLKLQYLRTAEDELLISGGGFPQLVYLELSNLSNLKGLRVAAGQPGEVMPKLKHLRISACPDMTVLPEAVNCFRALQVFEFEN